MNTIWRRIWRFGLVPVLSRDGLLALESALVDDDRRLLQGITCTPPPLDALNHRAIQGACALGWCGWHGDGLRNVGQLEAFFNRLCDAADAALKEPGACRFFLNWFDDTPRPQMRRELLAEVRLALERRTPAAA